MVREQAALAIGGENPARSGDVTGQAAAQEAVLVLHDQPADPRHHGPLVGLAGMRLRVAIELLEQRLTVHSLALTGRVGPHNFGGA